MDDVSVGYIGRDIDYYNNINTSINFHIYIAKYKILIYNKNMEIDTKVIEFKTYDNLPQEARNIRIEVFVKEQGFEYEFDSFDEQATHILAFDNDKAVATCRYYYQDGYYLIGRIAVIKEYRGLGLGAILLEFSKNEIAKLGGKEIRIHAQKRVQGFYQKQGYESFGEIDYDEGCEHVWMRKSL